MESTHYDASKNHRTPNQWNLVPIPERVALRAVSKADEDEGGCWISRYSVASHGYAQIGWVENGRTHMALAHRAAWVSVHGQVPVGMTIDHTCKVRRCVNPGHLRLLSNHENSRRNKGTDFPLGGCQNGHPDSSLVPVTRRTKSGEKRTGLTCGECVQIGRDRWVEQNPEKRREAWTRNNAKRRQARKDEAA